VIASAQPAASASLFAWKAVVGEPGQGLLPSRTSPLCVASGKRHDVGVASRIAPRGRVKIIGGALVAGDLRDGRATSREVEELARSRWVVDEVVLGVGEYWSHG
jgi:hypothetical protein